MNTFWPGKAEGRRALRVDWICQNRDAINLQQEGGVIDEGHRQAFVDQRYRALLHHDNGRPWHRLGGKLPTQFRHIDETLGDGCRVIETRAIKLLTHFAAVAGRCYAAQ